MRNKCPECGMLLVEPIGNPKATILIAGEFPGWEEQRDGRPFVGRSGQVLQTELTLAGVDINSCRLTNLWLHEKPGKKTERPCDLNYHLKRLVEEMQGRQHMLIMGSDICKALTTWGVMDVSGLWIVTGYGKVMVAPNPASSFHGTIGELRLALKRFAEKVNK